MGVAPRVAVALLGEAVHGAGDVARGEADDPRLNAHIAVVFAELWHALAHAEFPHAVEHLADVLGGQVGAQGPGGVDIAEDAGEIGHAGVHHALVVQGVREVDRLTIDLELDAAEHLKGQAGGGDQDVGVDVPARFELHAVGRDAGDAIGDHLGPAPVDGLEQVGVGDQAQALVPRVVAGREMGVHVVAGPQVLAHLGEQLGLDPLRRHPGAVVEVMLHQHVLPAGDGVGQPLRQHLAQAVGDGVPIRARHHVGGRTLNHGHLGRLLRHGRHQGHGGGAAADHGDALAAVVKTLRPMLGMDHRALKLLNAGKLGAVGLVVAVVAGAHEQEAAA